MAKSPRSAPAHSPEPDSLQQSIERLSGELEMLRQVIDELREDFSWVTRNGLPVQPVEHFVVKQMALDPCAKDWGDRLVIDRHSTSNGPISEFSALDDVVADLKATFEAVAQGHLEVVLTALGEVRRQLISSGKPSNHEVTPANSGTSDVGTPLAVPAPNIPKEKPPKGCLF